MNRRNKIGSLLYLLNLLVAFSLSFIIIYYKLLPSRIRLITIGTLILIQVLFGYLTFKKMKSKWFRYITNAFIIIILLASAYTTYALKTGMDSLEKITEEPMKEEIAFSFVVLKDSEIKDLDTIAAAKVLKPTKQDQNNIDTYLKQITELKNTSISTVDCNDYVEGAKQIISDKSKVLLLNETYRSLIDEQVPGFSEKTRIVAPNKISVETKPILKDVKSMDPFVMYISGIDTYGSLSSVSRSDVNLLLTVNPNTKKILIVSIPRDSYVPIAGGGNNEKDKLTHAGIYGISSSVQTLENLFDIDINYYTRINFSSLVTIVDVLGGIDIYNEQAFTSLHGNFKFPKGDIHLNGEEAISYARERYSLKEGDLDRGRNHEKILKAIIEKMLSPKILLNYADVLQVIMSSSETNIPKEKIIELVNNQLETSTSWRIDTTEVKGNSQSGLPSYAMPGWNLYMYVLEEGSISDVSGQIKGIINKD